MSVPDVDFDDGKLRKVMVDIRPPEDYNKIKLEPDNEENTYKVAAEGLSMKISSDFVMNDARGRAYIDISEFSFDMGIKIQTQNAKGTSEQTLRLECTEVTFDIYPGDATITLEGNGAAD